MPMSAREREAARFRAAIIARENAAVRFMELNWRHSAKRLQADIDSITAKIADARSKGKPVNRDWLRRQSEYKKLQQQLIREANQFNPKAAKRLSDDIDFAVSQGVNRMRAMHELQFSNPALNLTALDQLGGSEAIREIVTFHALPTEAMESIAGRVTHRSPAGKLLGKLGRDAAKEARKVLVNGVTRGENIRVIAKGLERAANLPKSRAMTIARTEIFGAYTDTMHEQMKRESAVGDKWVWVAQIGSACGGCLAMHGQTFELDEFMKKHPNCHCEPQQVPKPWAELGFPPELDRQLPPTIDPEAMQTDALNQIAGKSTKALQQRFGVGKGKLLADGKISLSDLARVTDNRVWGGATIETPLKYLTK